jgi:hypothetical protein
MEGIDRTSTLIKWRSLALGNQIVLQIAVPALFIYQNDFYLYGIWLAVNSYSSFIAFFDLGFFAVIPTSAIVQSSGNLTIDNKSHLIAMRKFAIQISAFGISLLLLILIFGRLLEVDLIKSSFFTYAVLSAINVFLILLLRYYEASFRSINSTYGFAILTIHGIATTISTILVLLFRGNILQILVLNLLISIAFLFHYLIKGDAFDSNGIRSFNSIQSLQKFVKPGIAYQLFSFGYIMINQGINIIIQHIGDYEVLGKLGAIRVIAGVFRQISSVIIASSIPQLSLLLKAEKFVEAGISFRYIKKIIYMINSFVLLVLTMGLFTYFLQGNSTVNKIPIIVCVFFILSAFFDLPWNVWIMVTLSVNKHTNLGLRFLFSSLLTLVLTAPAYQFAGLSGIAMILFTQDLVMTRQSIRQGKQILKLI